MNKLRRIGSQASFLLGLLVWVTLPTGCTTTGTQGEALPAQGPSEFIQAGDTIEITLGLPNTPTAAPNLPTEHKVKTDGSINLELIGDVIANAKTPKQLEQEIHDAYVPKYYKRVTVNVRQVGLFFFVDGEVKNSNRFPYVGEITLSGAIAAAGGFTDYADKKRIQVIRSGGRFEKFSYKKILNDPKQDVPIRPGDRIIVPRRPI